MRGEWVETRKSFRALGTVEEKSRERICSHDGLDAMALLERTAHGLSKSIPPFQFWIQRTQIQLHSATLDRIRWIEEQDCTSFVGDAREIFEVWIGSPCMRERRVGIARENKSDRISVAGERTQDARAACREFRGGDGGIRRCV